MKLSTHGHRQFLGRCKDTTIRHPPALASEIDDASASKMPPFRKQFGQTIQGLGVEGLMLEGQELDPVAEAISMMSRMSAGAGSWPA